MFWSKNNTFHKKGFELAIIKGNMFDLLWLKGRNYEENLKYIEAFDFFIDHPDKFDGATIVKDLNDLPNLDLDAMLHDYQYIKGANKDFVKKWKSDFEYIKNMEKNGKGIRLFRLFLLTITGILYVPYCKIIAKHYTKIN